jgi:tetratricopeptide (TPR) repeat protein
MSNLAPPNPIDIALQHHQAGRLADAETLYRQVLAAQPNHAGALHLLGILCGQTSRVAAGIDLLGRACAVSPQTTLLWIQLGELLRQAGQPDKAAAALQRAIQVEPASAQAHNNLGNALVDQGKHAQAAECYRTAARLDPRMDRAFSNLGVVLRQLGDPAQAIVAFKSAVEINPNSAIAHDNMGQALRDAGQIDAAMAAHLRAIQLDPNSSSAFNNISIALRMAGRLAESIAASHKAISLNPASADAYNNLGITRAEQGRLDEAIAAYRKSLQLRPVFQEAWTNLGNALADKGEFAEGQAACQRAVDINPAAPGAHFNLALILLTLGNFERGWVEYEWRWQIPGLYMPRPFREPRWDGQPLNGKTILLHADQGYGDTIQFIRYVAMIVQLGGRVVLGCDRPLKRLFEGYPGIAHVFSDNENVPRLDVHLPVASLGAVFKSNAATIPASVPYIRAKPLLVEAWQQKLAPFAGQLKVGLVWAGRPTHKNDRNRSLKLAHLAPLAADGITFFSLQRGPASSQAASPPTGMRLIDFTEDLLDFADTAALIANLDLAITVDTAVAHLAGAMAKPVWVMIPSNPDWRWLREREDSPWYPTMRLFRQREMVKWEDVIARMGTELRSIVKGDRL